MLGGGLVSKMAVLQKALDVRTHRHQVLASNVANADTPHYKARDIDFKSALQNAIQGNKGVQLSTTSSRHIQGSGDAGAASLMYRTETQSAVDGNTVDMDVERTQMSENAMQYEILTKLITDSISGMRNAIASNQG